MSDQSATRAQSLFDDPRITQARQLMLQALRDHQAELTDPAPPINALVADYQQQLAAFADLRGGGLYYPYLGSGLGAGALVELGDGSVKYDMITGIGVHCFGHSHPDLVSAAIDAALRDTIMQGNLQQNLESESLCQQFVDAAIEAGSNLRHCFITTSGAMANENALKLIFQKHYPADRVLAFEHCFMGRTLALSTITDKAANRQGLPLTIGVDYIPFFDPADPAGSTDRAVNALKDAIHRHPCRHACMCLELVQGEGGFNVGDHDFFIALIDVLKQNNIAVFVDEIQTFGRTTELFGFQTFDLAQCVDVITVGKLTQVCATLFSDQYIPRPGLISQTFTGASSSIRAAQCIMNHLRRGKYHGPDGRIAQIHQRFIHHFHCLHKRHPDWITGPHGLGGMIAFTAFDGSPELTKQTLAALYDEGVIAFLAGADPARIRMLPPFAVITDQQIDTVCERLEKALEKVAAKL
ncbi:aminotransferase class III-fold pyridoxal phosphate-dependent enzyme [Planctomycetales bacterium ZRK34]|nr:aminotransferase class III-fold pyridoxal phosphate-dependent enzyme [Planctomycetales bacterium ZRK34]